MCAPHWCPAGRQPPQSADQVLRADRARGQARFFERIDGRPGRFYFRHSLLPHGPYLYLPSGQRMRPTRQDPIPRMGSGPGFGERYLTQHKEQRLRLQIGLVDRQLGRLVGDPDEHFATMVPEAALRAGSNTVGVYEVLDAGHRLRLLAATPAAPR